MLPSSAIDGYRVPVHRAVWERILTLGAPRILSTLWFAICAAGALNTLVVLGFTAVLLPLVAWGIGQGLLVLLTSWDINWDEILIAQLVRRYPARYEA